MGTLPRIKIKPAETAHTHTLSFILSHVPTVCLAHPPILRNCPRLTPHPLGGVEDRIKVVLYLDLHTLTRRIPSGNWAFLKSASFMYAPEPGVAAPRAGMIVSVGH